MRAITVQCLQCRRDLGVVADEQGYGEDVTLFIPLDDVEGTPMYRANPIGARIVDLDAKRPSKLCQHARKDAAMSAFVHCLAPDQRCATYLRRV